MRRLGILTCCFALLLASAATAAAGDTDSSAKLADDAKPWASGVSTEAREAAKALYESGNEQFKAARHAEALKLYSEALEHWKHPRIHINAAAACLELERLLDAASHVQAARKYRNSLTDDDQGKLDNIVKAVEAGTGVVKVSSQQAGAVITIDGKQILVGPGRVEHRLLPGTHELVARRKGLASESRQIALEAGDSLDVNPVLFVVATEWRWAKWKPWALAGVGAAVAAAGAPLLLNARSLRAERSEFEKVCISDPASCLSGQPNRIRIDELDSSADTRTIFANAAFVTGGVMLATGITLAMFNRPTQVKRAAEDNEFQALMWIEHDVVGARVSMRF